MGDVRFDLGQCDSLIEAQKDAATRLRDSISALSPLIAEAHQLLDWVPHPNHSPLAGIHEAAVGLTEDWRDLDWRVEFVRRMDGSGFGDGVVTVTGMPDLTWEEAQAWYQAGDIDELWKNRGEGSIYEQQRNRERLEALIAEYIGTDDPAAIAAVIAGLRDGEPVVLAVHNAGVRMDQAAYVAQVNELARDRDLSFEEAENLFAELEAQTIALIAQGYSPHVAADVVNFADLNGFDIEEISDLASDEGIGLIDAATIHARAGHYAMTVPELTAYDGLTEHFDTFDNAKGGDTDGKVSLQDLHYVVNHPGRFTVEEVAAATALLASPGLLTRLDTGRDNNNVLNNGDSFGDDDFDDRKISLDDLLNFEWKQGVNSMVGTHYDSIDNVHGGELDGHLSKADFETFLAENRGDLSDDEILAFEAVIDGEFYDKGWLERNKRAIAIVAAVAVGAGIVFFTGGIGTGVSGALITAAVTGTGGAAAASATTIGINAISDESEWHDDVASNAGHGFLAGMAGGGLRAGAQHWVANPGTLSRTATGLGLTSDVAAITALGGFDPLIEVIPGVEYEDLDDIHDTADLVSLTTGVYGLGAAGADATVRWYTSEMADSIATRAPHLVDTASTFQTRGMSEDAAQRFLKSPEGLPVMQAVFGEGLENFDEKAMQYLVRDVASGTAPPTLVTENPDVLIKYVPEGSTSVSEFSPFFTTVEEGQRMIDQQRSIADSFGLPLTNSAPTYSVAEMAVPDDAVLFTSTVAPTRELYGNVRRNGGATQILAFNRPAFPEPVITDLVVGNGGLAPNVPIREAVTMSADVYRSTPPRDSGGFTSPDPLDQ